MGLTAHNTHVFHRPLFGGQLVSVIILKREDDQKEGTVRSIRVFQCRRSALYRTGEPIQGEMGVDHRTVWHIPKVEMKRVGINYFNPVDRIVEDRDQFNQPLHPSAWHWWQPEAPTMITTKLFNNMVNIDCLRIDPPREVNS